MSTPIKVKKWGTHLALPIPEDIAKAHGIKVGTILDLDHVGVATKKRRRYKLSELMAKFKPTHRHSEWALYDQPGKKDEWGRDASHFGKYGLDRKLTPQGEAFQRWLGASHAEPPRSRRP